MKYLKQLPHLILDCGKAIVKILKSKWFYLALFFIVWSYIIAWANSNYIFQVPFVLRPFAIQRYNVPQTKERSQKTAKNVDISPTPTVVLNKTERQIIDSYSNAEILWKVYGLESTWGRNDGCREMGKFNGYGFGQNKTSWNCFDTFEQVTAKVDKWFTDKFESGMSVNESLCFYNQGVKSMNCAYYQKYLSLSGQEVR